MTTASAGDVYDSSDGGVYHAVGPYETDSAGQVDVVTADTDGDGEADTTAYDPAGF